MSLAEEGEPLAYDIAFSLAEDRPDLRQREVRARMVANKLRALAVIVLLTRGDRPRFFGNLKAAAELRHDYLLAARSASSWDQAGREYAAGRAGGLFDSLAAGEPALALKIAALAPPRWRADCEYEDDFCWARLVGLLLPGTEPGAGEVAALLERFEASLQGQGSARLDLARALAERDAAGFGPAFEALLMEHGQQIDERIDAGEMDDAIVLADRSVFVEGLGLLALGEALGLPTEQEYLYCPGIARLAVKA